MKKPAGFDRYLNLAERFLARGRVPALLFAVARKSSRLKLVKSDLKLLQELALATVRGQYRELNPKALLAVVAALLYFLSPVDVIPDWIPGFGLLDDLAVLAWVVRHWQSELDAFKAWRDRQSVDVRQSLNLLPAPGKSSAS
ncbi:YkvA family protein [Pseudomonas sp. QL9]|uniref:YkvA family protein n=1 Tax=Pseudomonas TaxID=286 RepID=UPI00352B4747